MNPLHRALAMAGAFALVAGCATAPAPSVPAPRPATPSSTSPQPTMPAPDAPAAPSPLPGAAPGVVPAPIAAEKRWLEDLFAGTPVAIHLNAAQALQVDVPQVHSFDAGAATPRPALGAVLDRVAQSLRRQAVLRIAVGAAPDAAGPAALAASRAQRLRDQLVARQVGAARIAVLPALPAGSGVQLRMTMPPQPILRLDDDQLPRSVDLKPSAASRSASAGR